MTDNYDLDAHEHDGEHASPDDHESKAEAWQDEQPSVDDLLDETATASEEGSGAAHEEVVEVKKRKSILLPAIVGIGGLLALGAILHWQFNRSPSVASVQTAQSTAPDIGSHASVLAPNDADVSPKTSLASASGTSSSSALPSGQAGVAMPISPSNSSSQASTALTQPPINPVSAIPSPIADSTPSATAAMPSTSVADAAPLAPVLSPSPAVSAPLTPAPASSTSQPIVSSIVPPASVPAIEPANSSAVASTSSHMPIASVANNADVRIDSLSNRIDELKKSLDQTAQQLTQAQASVSAASGNHNTELDDRLTKIEQQLSQLEHTPPSVATAAAPSTASVPQETVAQAVKSSILAPASHKVTAVKHNKVATKVHKVKKIVSKAAPKHATKVAAKASGGWVLRAATPDEAWVAKDATTAELRHIQVGDELPGVGRVKAIQQAGDSWTVEGSLGSIH